VTKIKYSLDIMKYISMFESLTGARVKDCIVNDGIIFIIEQNEMGKAIGKKGANIKRIEGILKKKIKLIEYNDDVSKFIVNLIFPLRVKDIKEEEGVVSISVDDTKTKGMLIGRDKNKINSVNEIVKRYFKVEVKVL